MAILSKKTEKAEQKEKAENALVPAEHAAMIARVLVKPRISEKASRLANSNQYVFVVTKDANKISVKKAVEAAYKVKVTRVNIVNTEGKKRNYGRISGKMSDFKKAIVSVKEGQKIEGTTETI